MSTSIFRSQHGPQNPYVMLSKESLWDKELSLKAVGLWARMMSRPDDWTIRSTELSKSCGVNEDTIHKYMNELIRAGYAYRRKIIDEQNGRIIGWETIVFESKQSKEEIQKMFPQPKKPGLVNPGLVNTPPTNIDITNTEKTDISYVGENPPTTQTAISKETPKEKKALPIEAWDATNVLWSNIVRVFPKHLPPKLKAWAHEMDLMNRRDKRSWEDIRRVIDFVAEDAFWVKVVQGPDSLRRNFDKILAKMTPANNSGERYQRNRAMAYEAKSAIKSNEKKWRSFYIADKQLVRLDTNESIDLDLDSKIFEARMLQIFGLTKE